MVRIKHKYEQNTEKWIFDVVDWLQGNWRESIDKGSQERIIIPCDTWTNPKDYSVLEIDCLITYLSTKIQIEMYKKNDIDLTDVPFIQLRFTDKCKRVNGVLKDYMIYRIWGDLENNFTKDEIPFFFIQSGDHIRIYNTDMMNSNGKRIDKKEVK